MFHPRLFPPRLRQLFITDPIRSDQIARVLSSLHANVKHLVVNRFLGLIAVTRKHPIILPLQRIQRDKTSPPLMLLSLTTLLRAARSTYNTDRWSDRSSHHTHNNTPQHRCYTKTFFGDGCRAHIYIPVLSSVPLPSTCHLHFLRAPKTVSASFLCCLFFSPVTLLLRQDAEKVEVEPTHGHAHRTVRAQ